MARHALAQDTNEIPPLVPAYREMPPGFWEQHSAAVVAGVCLALVAIGFTVWRKLHPKPAEALPPEVVARRTLAELRGQPESGVVLSRVSQALRRFLAVAFRLPAGEMTTAEFCRALERSDKPGAEFTRAVGEFLRDCDERKFAPATSGAACEQLHAADRALQFVEQAEASFQLPVGKN